MQNTYSDNGKYGLEIWSKEVLVAELKGPDSALQLWLQDNRYSILEIKKYQTCSDCGRKFIKNHTCNTNRIVYKKIAEGKDRYVVNGFKQDKFNFDHPNEDNVIVHYDIETHTRSCLENMRVHIPYIVGFVDNISNHFKYFTGADCMEKFIVHLFSYSKESKLYINAYNGSKFDHYEFVKNLNKMYSERIDSADVSFKLDKLVLNNGAILKATVGNIDCFDISKHITGSLRQNLKEMGCVVQKGVAVR